MRWKMPRTMQRSKWPLQPASTHKRLSRESLFLGLRTYCGDYGERPSSRPVSSGFKHDNCCGFEIRTLVETFKTRSETRIKPIKNVKTTCCAIGAYKLK